MACLSTDLRHIGQLIQCGQFFLSRLSTVDHLGCLNWMIKDTPCHLIHGTNYGHRDLEVIPYFPHGAQIHTMNNI